MTEEAARIRTLARRDAVMGLLGAELVDAGRGFAVVRLRVRAEHLNFNGTCHGGVLFSLADVAFGLASNSHGQVAAAIDAHIGFTAPAREGDDLSASAWELSRSRRLATYRIDVHADEETLVAAFTGTVYITSRRHPDA